MKIELGGGIKPKGDGFINMDLTPNADIRHDLDVFPYPLEDDSVTHVYSSHCLEHLKHPLRVLHEIVRVCRIGSYVEIRTPHPFNPMAMCPGHLHVIGPKQWDHWVEEFVGENWIGCNKRLQKVGDHYQSSWDYSTIRKLYPNWSDDEVIRYAPGACHEYQITCTVVKHGDSNRCLDAVLEAMKGRKSPAVLELGTKRSRPDRSTWLKAEFQREFPRVEYFGLDIEAGQDVDLVGDVHRLQDVVGKRIFDCVIARSILEHVKKPWVVAEQIEKVTTKGSLVWVGVPWCFPTHGYPIDVWRISTEGLKVLFPNLHWEYLVLEYAHEAKIVPLENHWPHASEWNFEAPSHLHSQIVARKR